MAGDEGLVDEVIYIAIGTEPMQWVASQVLKSSIVQRASCGIEFIESWRPSEGWHVLMERQPRLKRGTKFSAWRWLVPELLAPYRGRAIYLDADQVVLTDIAGLWESHPDGFRLSAVCNVDPDGLWGKHTLRNCGKPYQNKVQTSVMVMDCGLCQWDCRDLFRRVARGGLSYRDLMQAAFIPRDNIHELSPRWNDFGIRKPDTKLIHWSHVASQPYRNPNHPTASVFAEELTEAIKGGWLTREDVGREIKKEHLHERYRNA